jgi:thiol-disulfide isomerase/thioredoxin
MMVTKKIIYIGSLLLLMLTSTALAQHKELKVGDNLPDLLIGGVINQKSKQVKLKELYKDGLLLIDFWATWCVPCIQEIKFLDELKAKNPRKFQVLMVTYEDKSLIEKFLSRSINRDVQTSNLVIATGDTLLHGLFQHRAIPHNIWIDSTGKVKAITGPEAVTSKNILNFNEAGVTDGFKTKNDIMTFNPTDEFHLGDFNFNYRSIITPYINGISGGVYGGGTKPMKFFEWNASIFQLYYDAYSLFSKSPSSLIRYNLVEVHTQDSLRIFFPAGEMKHLLNGSEYKSIDEWQAKNTFCYALTLPNRVSGAVFREYMFNDLERQFGIKAKIENRQMSCLVVTKGRGKLLKPVAENSAKPKVTFVEGSRLSIKAARIDEVLSFLFGSAYSLPEMMRDPYIVAVKARNNFYFNAELDFSDEPGAEELITPEMIFRKLGKFGFRFKTAIKPYPILVLYDQH